MFKQYCETFEFMMAKKKGISWCEGNIEEPALSKTPRYMLYLKQVSEVDNAFHVIDSLKYK